MRWQVELAAKTLQAQQRSQLIQIPVRQLLREIDEEVPFHSSHLSCVDAAISLVAAAAVAVAALQSTQQQIAASLKLQQEKQLERWHRTALTIPFCHSERCVLGCCSVAMLRTRSTNATASEVSHSTHAPRCVSRCLKHSSLISFVDWCRCAAACSSRTARSREAAQAGRGKAAQRGWV